MSHEEAALEGNFHRCFTGTGNQWKVATEVTKIINPYQMISKIQLNPFASGCLKLKSVCGFNITRNFSFDNDAMVSCYTVVFKKKMCTLRLDGLALLKNSSLAKSGGINITTGQMSTKFNKNHDVYSTLPVFDVPLQVWLSLRFVTLFCSAGGLVLQSFCLEN